jgi:L-iditol 2-dehydrogenase
VRALVKSGSGLDQVRLAAKATPVRGPTEVLIRVKGAAVCASDIHLWHDRLPCTPPIVLGHEFCGVIEEVGPDVPDLRPGDTVVAENNPGACGRCRVCASGFPNLCPSKKAIGFKSDGCFADYLRITADLVHRVPPGISAIEAALSEPLAVAVHGVEDRCGIVPGDTVVVMGPGAIGLLAAQVARAEGAGRVIVVGTRKDEKQRLACARQLGLETSVVEVGDLEDRLKAATEGLGADVVIEASGAVQAIHAGIGWLRRAGRMAVIGLPSEAKVELDWSQMVSMGLRIEFSYSSRPRNWRKALEYLASGIVQTKQLITTVVGLDEWRSAFEGMERQETIRTVFDMGIGS